jgi:alpha-galactosidase
MVVESTPNRLEMGWKDGSLELRVEVGDDGVARLTGLAGDLKSTAIRADDAAEPLDGNLGLPLVDVITFGSGRKWSGRRYAESVVGGRLRYVSHDERMDANWHELEVHLEDLVTGLEANVIYRVLEGSSVLRSRVRLTNRGSLPVTLESVTSFLGSGLAGPRGALSDVDLWWAENDWFGEGRWRTRALRDILPDLGTMAHKQEPRGAFAITNVGSWSSGTYLPMGAAVNRRTGHCWLWQIENNGAWQWQVGERCRPVAESAEHAGTPSGAFLALLGPTDAEHQWRLVLQPGESFSTVPVALAVSNDGFAGAVAGLTRYRRAVRRQHEDNRRLPVIFNDYMNTLMGDPTTERLLPLIAAAARAGAECFCIDSGWYTEVGEAWWDSVGAWRPSKSRFPNGITEVLDRIRGEGMVVGLWLEPEVVGVRSPVAEQLPLEAFFARNGERVVESGRYHLDLSHPEARAHLDQVVDSLAGELGVGYLKMDYNVVVAPGTDTRDPSPGVGMLAHNRAFLEWVDGILDRHPGLTVESCASGGMRTDYALLSHFQLHSTSDQQDYLRYPPISAAAPVALPPEQAACWAYPQPEWSDDEIAFTLCNALLGRIHLSGHIDRMSAAQQQLVADAIRTYKRIRADLATAAPFWPLGLPGWEDPWVALGMRATTASYVVVWNRGLLGSAPRTDRRAGSSGPAELAVPVAHMSGANATAEVLYPVLGGAAVDWSPSTAQLMVKLPSAPAACLIGVAPGPPMSAPRSPQQRNRAR